MKPIKKVVATLLKKVVATLLLLIAATFIWIGAWAGAAANRLER